MVVQLTRDAAEESTAEVWVAEFGLLSAQSFDFESKKYLGKVYRLSAELGKQAAEALGFTAKFDSPSVRVAYLDINKNDLIAVVEMARNTKPADVALRYSNERWLVLESGNKGNESINPWRKTSYRAKSLSDQGIAALCDAARIDYGDRDKFFMRLNFKDGTCGLIATQDHVGKFPAGAYSSFFLPSGQTAVVPARNEGPLDMADKETSSPASSYAAGSAGASASGTKYATYSRSEVDQLLKQQADQLSTLASGKVSSQKKELQEALKNQEKSIAKIAEELHAYSESVKKQLEAKQNEKHADIDNSAEKARQDLVKQIEQFNTHFSKSVMPSLKNLDDRVRTIVEKTLEPANKEQPKPDSKPAVILAVIAILISVVNSILILAHR